MVVCKYFLENRCFYGDNCRNEHPRGGGGGGGGHGGGARVSFRDSFGTGGGGNTRVQNNPYRWTAAGSAQQQGGAAGTPADDVVRAFPKEIEIWQQSKMWPFSCIAIEKDIPSLPDFPDVSPEELRFDAYTAKEQGNIESYKMKVSQLLQEYRQKQEQIKNMSPALRQKLVDLVEEGRRKKASGGGSMLKPSVFGTPSGGGTFGAGAGTSSLFGSSPSSPLFQGSSFGGAQGMQGSQGFGQSSGVSLSTFGTSSGSGVFGQQSPGGGLFGKGGATSVPASGGGGMFGQAASSGSIFGQASGGGAAAGFGQNPGQSGGFGQNASAGSIFGQANPSSPSASLFGQTVPSSGAIPAPGLFSQASAGTSSVFGGSSAAGSGQTAPSLFGQSSAFGQHFQSTGFGSLAGSNPSQPASSAGFGSAGAATSQPQSQQVVQSSVYTPMDQLTEEEKAQFQAPTFTLGLIPMRPPPKELIN